MKMISKFLEKIKASSVKLSPSFIQSCLVFILGQMPSPSLC